jgi:hypothetical protein
MHHEYVAIDPLALLLPTSIYLILQEKINPHQPAVAALSEVAKAMTPEQRAFVQSRIRTLNTYTAAMQEAMGGRVAAAGN